MGKRFAFGMDACFVPKSTWFIKSKHLTSIFILSRTGITIHTYVTLEKNSFVEFFFFFHVTLNLHCISLENSITLNFILWLKYGVRMIEYFQKKNQSKGTESLNWSFRNSFILGDLWSSYIWICSFSNLYLFLSVSLQ